MYSLSSYDKFLIARKILDFKILKRGGKVLYRTVWLNVEWGSRKGGVKKRSEGGIEPL